MTLDKSAGGAGSTEIPAGRAPTQSDHSPRCVNAVCSPGTAPSFARRHLKKELNLLQLTAGLMTKTGTSPKVVRRKRLDLTSPRFLLHDTPNYLGAESVTPNPASFVDRTTERAGCNSGGRLQTSIPAFTQSGTGMVRMWPPLPTRSAMTQCSSLCCMSSTRNAVNSARRRPQPSRMANVA